VSSDFSQTTTSNDAGGICLRKYPIGEYSVEVQLSGFQREQQRLALSSSRDVRLHFSLKLAGTAETVNVSDEPITVNPVSSSTSTIISRAQITQTRVPTRPTRSQ